MASVVNIYVQAKHKKEFCKHCTHYYEYVLSPVYFFCHHFVIAPKSSPVAKDKLRNEKRGENYKANTVLNPAFKRQVPGICPENKTGILFVETLKGPMLLIDQIGQLRKGPNQGSPQASPSPHFSYSSTLRQSWALP